MDSNIREKYCRRATWKDKHVEQIPTFLLHSQARRTMDFRLNSWKMWRCLHRQTQACKGALRQGRILRPQPEHTHIEHIWIYTHFTAVIIVIN